MGHRAHDEQAGVHRQRDAGNPARLIARQKNRRRGDVPAGAFSFEVEYGVLWSRQPIPPATRVAAPRGCYEQVRTI